jgi:hypothetical protein
VDPRAGLGISDKGKILSLRDSNSGSSECVDYSLYRLHYPGYVGEAELYTTTTTTTITTTTTTATTSSSSSSSSSSSNDTNKLSNLCTYLDGPLGLQEVEVHRIFRQSAHEGGKVFSTTHRPPLPPGHTPVTHFCYRLSRPQGHSAAGRMM